MEAAFPGSASAKPDGKAKTAGHAINKSISACRAVPTTDIMTWKRAPAFATDTGLDMTVHRLFAAWTADRMEFASHRGAVAIRDGQGLCANN